MCANLVAMYSPGDTSSTICWVAKYSSIDSRTDKLSPVFSARTAVLVGAWLDTRTLKIPCSWATLTVTNGNGYSL